MTLDDVKRKAVLEALARRRGNKVKAAEDLGVSLKGLYNLLDKYRRQGHVAQGWFDTIKGMEAATNG